MWLIPFYWQKVENLTELNAVPLSETKGLREAKSAKTFLKFGNCFFRSDA